MAIIFCFIFTIILYLFIAKREISWIKLFICNFIFAFCGYVYYIGYSLNELKAVMLISPNMIYFTILSLTLTVAMGFIIRYGKTIYKCSNGKINYSFTITDKWCFLFVILVAFIVRIIGVDWGNAMTFHPDEGNLVRPPIYMAENNTLMSDETLYPTQITSKILSVIYKVWMLMGDLFQIEITEVSYYYIARIYIVLLSTGIVACMFFIGNYFKKNAGVLAAFITAIFPPFVQAAHCVTGDTFVALCMCLAILCSVRYIDDNRDYLWISLLCLLAIMATLDKYHGMMLCGIIAIVVCVKQIKERTYGKIITQGLFSVSMVVLLAFLIVPNLFMNLNKVLSSIFHLSNDYEEGATFLQNVYTYSTWFFSHAGILSFIPMIEGVVYLVKKKDIKAFVLIIGFIEILVICLQNRHYIRWGYPFYLVLIIFIGIGAISIKEKIKSSTAKIVFGLGSCLICINILVGTLLVDVLYANSNYDTRSISKQWCEFNKIVQDDCIYDHYTCWSPGGVSPYEWKFNISIEESVEKQGEHLIVNHLGKAYAVENLKDKENGILDKNGLEKIEFFRADYLFSDSGFGQFDNLSAKIFEPYSIFYCITNSWGIIRGDINFGSNIAIYDISELDAYEVFLYDKFEKNVIEQDVYLVTNIDSALAGIYTIYVDNVKLNGTIYIETETGERIAECEVRNGTGTFILDKKYYDLRMRLAELKEFEYIKIAR